MGKIVHELQYTSTDPYYKVNDIDLFNMAGGGEDVLVTATQSDYSYVWGRPYELCPTVEKKDGSTTSSCMESLGDLTLELDELRI